MKSTIGWESNGKKAPILWEKYEYQFPRFSQYDGFCWIFLCNGKLMGKPCTSHVTKDTTEWESNGKKALILWEKYEYQFPRSSPYDGFCGTFQYYGKLIIKPMYFPYNEVYHRIGIRWRKSTHAIGKVSLLIFQVFPIQWVLSHFPALWEIDGKTHVFPIR